MQSHESWLETTRFFENISKSSVPISTMLRLAETCTDGIRFAGSRFEEEIGQSYIKMSLRQSGSLKEAWVIRGFAWQA